MKLLLQSNQGQFPKQYIETTLKESVPNLKKDNLLFYDDYRKALYNHGFAYLKEDKNIVKIIKSEYSPISRLWLVLNILLNARGNDPALQLSKVQEETLQKIALESTESMYLLDYFKKSSLLETNVFKEGQLMDIYGHKIDFSSILDKKIIYVDFWASWCGPCRAEMPDSKALKEEFKSTNIQFVYISIDTNPAAWEKAMKQIGLDNGESFLLPKANDSEISKKLALSSIPRYVIFNKKGELINADAPRPSDPRIREVFNELLKK